MGTGDTEPPKGVDEERVNEIVNKALSARFKEQEKKTEKSNAAMIETIKSEVGALRRGDGVACPRGLPTSPSRVASSDRRSLFRVPPAFFRDP